jgi:hypothetical protein
MPAAHPSCLGNMRVQTETCERSEATYPSAQRLTARRWWRWRRRRSVAPAPCPGRAARCWRDLTPGRDGATSGTRPTAARLPPPAPSSAPASPGRLPPPTPPPATDAAAAAAAAAPSTADPYPAAAGARPWPGHARAPRVHLESVCRRAHRGRERFLPFSIFPAPPPPNRPIIFNNTHTRARALSTAFKITFISFN